MRLSFLVFLAAILVALFAAGCGGNSTNQMVGGQSPLGDQRSVAQVWFSAQYAQADEIGCTELVINIKNIVATPIIGAKVTVWDYLNGGPKFTVNFGSESVSDTFATEKYQNYWKEYSYVEIVGTGSKALSDDVHLKGVTLPDLFPGQTMKVVVRFSTIPEFFDDPETIVLTYVDAEDGKPWYSEYSDLWQSIAGKTLVIEVKRAGHVGRSEDEWYVEMYRAIGPFNWENQSDMVNYQLAATFFQHDFAVDNSDGERGWRAEYTPDEPGMYLLKAYSTKGGKLLDTAILSVGSTDL